MGTAETAAFGASGKDVAECSTCACLGREATRTSIRGRSLDSAEVSLRCLKSSLCTLFVHSHKARCCASAFANSVPHRRSKLRIAG